jgi:two-component system sensor histidine kinase AlgZ
MQLTYAHLPAKLRPANPSSLRAVPFHVVVIGLWATLGYAVGNAAVAPLFPPPEEDPTREWAETPLVMAAAVLVGTPIFLRGVHYRERLAESRARELRAQREALAAQVQALQARMEPHFLFNGLNTVASLIGEDPDRAERALERLSDLLRYALDASQEPFVPLSRELEAVEGFLELEKLRFPDRLTTSVRVDPNVAEVRVPPLFLQPLVENSVRHAIAPRREGGRLEVEIARDGNRLSVRVEDDGPGFGSSPHQGAGLALNDLRRRLELLYGDEASLAVERGTLGGCRVSLCLPVQARRAPGAEGES